MFSLFGLRPRAGGHRDGGRRDGGRPAGDRGWRSGDPLGSGALIDAAAARSRLAELGADGVAAVALDNATGEVVGGLGGLSELTVPLALSYLDRIARPLEALDLRSAVKLTTHGYAAHLVVEAKGAEMGITTVPVLGHLPAMKHGRPPQQLLTVVVKATRRDFDAVRAVSAGTWDGLVVCVARRTHAQRAIDSEGLLPAPLGLDVIDALLRFGWVLRQVDLNYGFAPERSGAR